jgi:hypothetical protein
MKRVVGVIGTVLVHATVVLILLWSSIIKSCGDGESSTPSQPPLLEVRLISKSSDDISIQSTLGKDSRMGMDGNPDPRICNDKDASYIGIGIIYSIFTAVVLSAPSDYPAYKAGIRVDDILLDPHTPADKDGYVIYRILRGKDQLLFRVKQERICYEEE